MENVFFKNMERTNIIQQKSYTFALVIIALCQYLQKKKEYVLSKQVLKSGTSIGANVEEASQAQSRSDFINKMSIALKEAYETRYWLRLLRDSKTVTSDQVAMLLKDIDEIIRILVTIVKTAKARDR